MDKEILAAFRRVRGAFHGKGNHHVDHVEMDDLLVVARYFLIDQIDPVSQLVCECLPEDWKIEIELEDGSGSMKLIDPEGNEVDEFPDDEGGFVAFALDRVNYARAKDGLDCVTVDGEWTSRLPRYAENVTREEMHAAEEDSYLDPEVPVFDEEDDCDG